MSELVTVQTLLKTTQLFFRKLNCFIHVLFLYILPSLVYCWDFHHLNMFYPIVPHMLVLQNGCQHLFLYTVL